MLALDISSLTFVALAIISGVSAQTAGGYQQCGGLDFVGPTVCVSGWHCEKLNDWYYQCLPGGASGTTSTPSPTIAPPPPPPPPTGGTSPASSPTIAPPPPPADGPGTTLRPNYYWIRAVVAPNFHKYLQSSTLRTASDAVLNSPTSAGQFNIVSGQLVQLINTSGTLLYAHVTLRADSTVNRLLITWGSTPDTYGTFGFQGDTVTWSTASITRQNTAAFLVCENQRLYINLGAYGYMTPAGCADQTIHYYNGATADA